LLIPDADIAKEYCFGLRGDGKKHYQSLAVEQHEPNQAGIKKYNNKRNVNGLTHITFVFEQGFYY